MELLQIKYFKVIAQTENISKAAQLLYIAQPSLSQTLKRLEKELGTPLFDRNGKKITLNAAGKIFLKYCDNILGSVENAKRELAEYNNNPPRDVNISVECASLHIPDIIERIRKSFPEIMPHIYQSGCDDWDIKLYSDCGNDCCESSLLLTEEPIGVLMPKGHPLADKAEITRADLSDYAFISLGTSSNLYKIIAHFCKRFNFTQNTAMYVDSPAIMRELLKMNLGIAFVPQYTWHSFYKNSLIFRPVSDLEMKRFVRLAANDRKFMTKAGKNCFSTIADYFEEYTRIFR